MTFIIAEVGSNWLSYEDLVESIVLAKNCGADAVKFQLFNHQDLYGYPSDHEPFAVKREWIPRLKEKADSVGVEFMCTAFSPEGMAYLDRFVKRHKIASSDLTYKALLMTANKLGRPVLLSTGASSQADIKKALSYLEDVSKCLLYCVSNYPSKMHNLYALDVLRSIHSTVGFSDHSEGIYAALSAVDHHKASVIEKHFKIRDMNTPDSPHSIGRKEFKAMCQMIRKLEQGQSVADMVPMPCPEELGMLQYYNRRLVATKPIAKGEALYYGVNYDALRVKMKDLEGLNPLNHEIVEGKLATRNIEAFTPIKPQLFG